MAIPPLPKAEARRQQLLELLKLHKKLSIHEMIQHMNCSEATVRRDLDLLEQTGEIFRTAGGARYHDPLRGVSFHEKEQLYWKEKEIIAAKAASLVQQGDIVGLTGGTTTFLIARELKNRPEITVVTNAVNIAMELAESQQVQVVLTGGVMSNETFELSGPLAEAKLEGLHINKMFIGVDGIHPISGLTTHSELEARMAQIMMSRSDSAIAVFDGSKANKSSIFPISPLGKLEAIVCNTPLQGELLAVCEQESITLHLAGGSPAQSAAPNEFPRR
ncbi:DeoR/GlpR family DNA-binding transcription regulator [Paenibacillus mendelii]|uniref:DeoR/GlpR family DNA-binding transcription regulator n=1 Tax=Paenibacillus mendelii TaxID=206163 RepID=A0ABV6J1L8_9BACL|nr:DeoR/GlpR family DNA-binding transcription regulator [Paenibacillus mendelii]MCQ6563230.1 DeoR/GlpR family DNA-binding transcription regulator [Paenibacillus mendelii]